MYIYMKIYIYHVNNKFISVIISSLVKFFPYPWLKQNIFKASFLLLNSISFNLFNLHKIYSFTRKLWAIYKISKHIQLVQNMLPYSTNA